MSIALDSASIVTIGNIVANAVNTGCNCSGIVSAAIALVGSIVGFLIRHGMQPHMDKLKATTTQPTK
jgi:membrane associated rhomboid family serine protease